MRLSIFILVGALSIGIPSVVFPQDGGTPDGGTAVEAPDTSLDEKPDLGTVAGEVTEVIDTAKNLKSTSEDAGKLVAMSALLAAIFKLLLSLLKLTSGLFKNKVVPKLTALSLGLLVYVFANLALGMPWLDALILALSGPGAIVFHEITKLIPIVREAKDASSSGSTK